MPVTINCDMGEGFGLYRIGDDEELMRHVTVANVACGFHASDPSIMAKTIRLARKHGVAVGAHPSLPDRQGFGRREMRMGREELTDAIVYQIGALKGFLDVEGMTLNHVKPHGALYAMAQKDADVAEAVCDAVAPFGVPLMGLPGTLHEKVYTRRGIGFIAEFFADLEYDRDGNLLITREHVAVSPETAARRVVRAIREGKVRSCDGSDIPVRADTVCVHSDTPGAAAVARAVGQALDSMEAAA